MWKKPYVNLLIATFVLIILGFLTLEFLPGVLGGEMLMVAFPCGITSLVLFLQEQKKSSKPLSLIAIIIAILIPLAVFGILIYIFILIFSSGQA